jgi:periplasmic copper chaperone A
MTRGTSTRAAIGLLALLVPALASGQTAGDLAISHPWTRPTPGTMTPGVGYMTLENHGPVDDRLLSAESPAAGAVTMHKSEVKDGIARMLPHEEGIAIPAHGSASLEPGGYHLMLSNLKAPLALGQAVPLTLTFAKAGRVTVELRVERPSAAQGEHGSHQGSAH